MNASGYMPLNANYGFIFVGGDYSSIHDEIYQNTIAHELGHGIFKLYHPYDVYNTPERQTNNLMDYQMGATLWKPQWDWIHDPGIRTYMFQGAEEGAMIGCLAPKPDKPGMAEGEEKTTEYQGKGQISHGEYLSYGCSTHWRYFMGWPGITEKPDWYEEKEYNRICNNIATFSSGVFPIYIHGTWSNPTTFDPILKSEINKCLPWSLINNSLDIKWSGANEQSTRESVAKQAIIYFKSKIFIDRLKSIGMDKHLLIIAHSHGGNIAKLIKNELDIQGWIVDIINISTPQRTDTHTSKGSGLYLNFYCNTDLIQEQGVTDTYFDAFLKISPPSGARIDPIAMNHEVFPFHENCNTCNFTEELKNTIRAINEWIDASAGHGIHNNSSGMRQILYWINYEFNKTYKQ